MTNFVYVLGTGSRWDNNELRYSLRSLSRNYTSQYDVWIVGHYPAWVRNAVHIACSDLGRNPIRNVARKLLFALDNLPDEFVLMNDDFYLMHKMGGIPLVHGGPIVPAIKRQQGNSLYMRALRKTYIRLLAANVAKPVRYDRHTPFPMTRQGMHSLTIEWPTGEFLLKTLYGNMVYKGEGIPVDDVKTPLPGRGNFWSTPSVLVDVAKKRLADTFPVKSPNEA